MNSVIRHLIIGSFLGLGVFFRAQTIPYLLLNVGYQNVDGNYGTVGTSLYLVQNNDNIISFSLNANMGYMKNHFVLIPEGEVGYTFSGKNHSPYKDVNASFFKPAIAFTPYSIQPKIGISALNLLDIYAGYSFQFREPEFTSLDGISVGVEFQIPFQVF